MGVQRTHSDLDTQRTDETPSPLLKNQYLIKRLKNPEKVSGLKTQLERDISPQAEFTDDPKIKNFVYEEY